MIIKEFKNALGYAKIGKKHGYKDGRMIQVNKVSVIGYF